MLSLEDLYSLSGNIPADHISVQNVMVNTGENEHDSISDLCWGRSASFFMELSHAWNWVLFEKRKAGRIVTILKMRT